MTKSERNKLVAWFDKELNKREAAMIDAVGPDAFEKADREFDIWCDYADVLSTSNNIPPEVLRRYQTYVRKVGKHDRRTQPIHGG